MLQKSKIAILLGILLTFILISSCKRYFNQPDISESIEFIKSTVPIPEAQNVTMDLKDGHSAGSLHLVNFSNIKANSFINNGLKKAWCIEWDVRSIKGIQKNVKLHSTAGKSYWNKLNYLLNQIENLREMYPELTWREIQVVIWSIVDYKPFSIDEIPSYRSFPGNFYNDGEYLFDVPLSKKIIQMVEDNSNNSPGEKFAIIVENEGQIITTSSE